MTLDFFSGFQETIVNSFGSIYILALGIILFFTIAFLILNIDFRLVLLLDTILIIGMTRMEWLPAWVEGVFWIGVVGLGIYIAWGYIGER